ncbi:uncharacterized protein LOC144576526 [Callithrix jacchus]
MAGRSGAERWGGGERGAGEGRGVSRPGPPDSGVRRGAGAFPRGGGAAPRGWGWAPRRAAGAGSGEAARPSARLLCPVPLPPRGSCRDGGRLRLVFPEGSASVSAAQPGTWGRGSPDVPRDPPEGRAGEGTRALAVEDGRSARKGEPGLQLPALPGALARHGASPGREGLAPGRAAGRGVASGGLRQRRAREAALGAPPGKIQALPLSYPLGWIFSVQEEKKSRFPRPYRPRAELLAPVE